MIKLIKLYKLGFELYTIVWTEGDKGHSANFWSEELAKRFIVTRFKHITMDSIEVEDLRKYRLKDKTDV